MVHTADEQFTRHQGIPAGAGSQCDIGTACYVERSADLKKAASDVIIGKTFDNGVLCSSPNSVVVDEAVAEETRRELVAEGAYFMNAAEMEALAKALVTPQRLPNPALVGKR